MINLKVKFNKSIKPIEISLLYSIITIMPFIIVFLEKMDITERNFILHSYMIIVTFLISTTILEILTSKPYLSLIFGCHNLCERSFKFRGYYFPICARCTGIYLGILLSITKVIFKYHFIFSILLLLPLIIDGLFQNFTKYKSNNIKRVFTGLLFGIGSIEMFLLLVYINNIIFDYIFDLIY